MAFTIDTDTYRKDGRYPVGHGYALRIGIPTSIVIHSTEGARGQSFASAAQYLLDSADVSAHFLVGRAGEIVRFLNERTYAAWHAGDAIQEFSNAYSIGIECLHARGEDWPQIQKDALGFLLRQLMTAWHITPRWVDTHGQVALPGPYGRKKDPTDWPRADVLAFVVAQSHMMTYRVKRFGTVPRQSRDPGALPAAYIPPGTLLVTDDVTNGWAHVGAGDAAWGQIGFCPIGDLEAV